MAVDLKARVGRTEQISRHYLALRRMLWRHFSTEEPWVLEWIRIPSDTCRRVNSIWIRYVWTGKSGKKKLRIQKYLDMCGRGLKNLSRTFFFIFPAGCNRIAPELEYNKWRVCLLTWTYVQDYIYWRVLKLSVWNIIGLTLKVVSYFNTDYYVTRIKRVRQNAKNKKAVHGNETVKGHLFLCSASQDFGCRVEGFGHKRDLTGFTKYH